MCGICGIYNNDGKPVSQDILDKMTDVMSHRGPDDRGLYIRRNIGLGHRRLSIIDLSTGHQPIFNEDKSKVIIFNGEIYNFVELRSALEAYGHVFSSHSDTEVIVHAYEKWGTDCVHKLRGMFAFAIWDNDNESLFLARDRLGIKPLYFYLDGRKVVFASELKAIIQDRSIPTELNLEAFSDYLSFGYVPSPKTIFKGIQKLPPGHTLLVSRNGSQLKQYWDVRFHAQPDRTLQEISHKLLETIRESVRIRLISDVPLGAFLSGGVDSSAVVAIMSSLMSESVITTTVGFNEKKYDEMPFARLTASLFKTTHHEYVVTPNAVDVVTRLAWHFDEPFADFSSIPTYYVSKMARNKVTVALSGDGGDENFAGYRRYFFDRLENHLRKYIPELIRTNLLGPLARIYPQNARIPQIFRAKTLLTNLSHDALYGYFNSMSMISPELKKAILTENVHQELGEYDSIDVFRYYYNRSGTKDPLSIIQYIDFKTYLVDDILTKVDRASMANSLEVRVPILDHHLVELGAQIPSHHKLNGTKSKYVFKESLRSVLPIEILERRKMGFTPPIGEWLRGELRELAEDMLFRKSGKMSHLFELSEVGKLWEGHLSRTHDYKQPLWTLLCFQLWAQEFL